MTRNVSHQHIGFGKIEPPSAKSGLEKIEINHERLEMFVNHNDDISNDRAKTKHRINRSTPEFPRSENPDQPILNPIYASTKRVQSPKQILSGSNFRNCHYMTEQVSETNKKKIQTLYKIYGTKSQR